ncbi:MAG TPA: LysM peptidoglycan-binding domain-containing protein [Ktedonobacterales bacterium]|nr:LysM peptidoglycan-binding domain-containing protein [Ktedonobacterales bacterium]
MGLDYLRERPRNVGSSRSSVDLLERELPPLTPPRYPERPNMGADVEDAELAEFVEFFTGSQRTVTASAVQTPPAPSTHPSATKASRGRVRRVTERVVHVAGIRPEVRVPRTLRARMIDSAATRSETAVVDAEPQAERHTFKLPPVWMLTNLAIIAALLIGFAPQLMTASAAAGCKWYRVQPGDTLGKLSHRYGVTINQLATANHIQNVNLIYVDQNMCIPMMPLASSNQPAPAPAPHAPAYSAPANVSAFINYTLPYARKASAQTGWPVSVILAQWGLETGWRTRTYTGYNWGNCGAMPGQPTIGGINKPGSPAAFAYANTPSQGLAEYVHVAHLGYYTRVAQAAHSGSDAAARALGQSPWDWGHYTNRNDPGSSLVSIMRVYNLYYYDTH